MNRYKRVNRGWGEERGQGGNKGRREEWGGGKNREKRGFFSHFNDEKKPLLPLRGIESQRAD